MSLQYQVHNQDFATLPQIAPGDLRTIAADGYKSVINNRPDFEGGPTQPMNAEFIESAMNQGLTYVYLPVVTGKITDANVTEFAKLIEDLPKPIIAFCRTGTRSTALYGMALRKV